MAKDTAHKERRDEVGFEASRWPRCIPALRIGFGVGGVSLPSFNKKCVVCPELRRRKRTPSKPGRPPWQRAGLRASVTGTTGLSPPRAPGRTEAAVAVPAPASAGRRGAASRGHGRLASALPALVSPRGEPRVPSRVLWEVGVQTSCSHFI